ncbi:class I SAM-dependent methyltransferase [Flagellimonas sp. S3867]|uniref:class I SAM-dependent methyltransferase n=1 Tax=Flagellimonas sp. S3867 TaxID=2768063 RepID=UPI001CC22B59|nr:class I SAM-dependent methyltransferase [Flagellimonas sp. S3867]
MTRIEEFDRKTHWENLYRMKEINEVSWYQPNPETSLRLIEQFNPPTNAKIIDVGGGNSFLVDHLLDLGYTNVTVLDISGAAIKGAKQRLGEKASQVNWIITDIVDFKPIEIYDFWHDRAAFHFLTEEEDIQSYLINAYRGIKPNGILILGTFSNKGPKQCSGIEIRQYSETSMAQKFKKYFKKIGCKIVDHITPSGTIQNFVFCSFRNLRIKEL